MRYRHLILTRQPFAEQIDYSLPIELIAIAPSFNEDSLIDKAACKFESNIQLLTFSFTVSERILHLSGRKHFIPYSIAGLADELSSEAVPKWSEMRETVPNLAALTYNISDKNRDDFWNLRKLFLAQPKVKEIVNSLGIRVFYATSHQKGCKTLAEICVSKAQVSLFLCLPSRNSYIDSYGLARNAIKLKRFEIIFSETNNLFKLDSQVQYLALSSTRGITVKERVDLSVTYSQNRLISGRDGMPKWCEVKDYMFYVSLMYKNPIVFQELFPDFVSANPTGWWQEFKTQETDKLGWFVDLAIRAWRYKI